MANQLWDEPVTLRTGDDKGYRVVKSTREAIECLARSWPGDRGKYMKSAIVICMRGLAGVATSQEVREAFVKAAGKGKVLIH